MTKKEGEVTSRTVELVDTQWLNDNISREKMTILDVQPNIHDHIAEHIPGSVYFNPDLLRVPLDGRPGSYVPAKVAGFLFGRVGISRDRPVVVYTGKGAFKGWGDGLEQTMIAYSLARFSHDSVKVLDGGLEKWKEEGRELTKDFPKITPMRFDTSVNEDLFMEYQEFKRRKDEENVVVLDARPPDLYAGQGPWRKPGHIPGAVNLPWRSLMDDDNPRLLKPLGEITQELEKMGIDHYKDVICTCGTGREATNEFLLFKYYLNYPKVKLYEGSFTEWTSHPENLTVTGPDPR